jgi:hypothetical protein
MWMCGLGLSVACQQEYRVSRSPARKMGKEFETGRIGPLKIIEGDEKRRFGLQRSEETLRGVEEPETVFAVVSNLLVGRSTDATPEQARFHPKKFGATNTDRLLDRSRIEFRRGFA